MPPKRNKAIVENSLNIDNLPFDTSKLSEESKLIVSILMYTVNQTQEMFSKSLREKDKIIDNLNDKVTKLEQKIMVVESKLDDDEATVRLNDVIISGENVPNFQQGESTNIVACDLLKSKLNTHLPVTDILKSFRVGKRSPNGPDKRNILVKFARPENKSDIMLACRTMKPEKLFINECLSPIRNSIMYVLRRAKKDFPLIVSGCNSIDGNVYVWINPPNPNAPGAKASRMQVNDFQKLSQFCDKVINSSVSTYIPEWQH